MNNFIYDLMIEIYKSLFTDHVVRFTLLLFFIMYLYSESLAEIDTFAKSIGVNIWKK